MKESETRKKNGEQVYITWKVIDDVDFPPLVISPSDTHEYDEHGNRREFLQITLNRAYVCWLGYQRGTIAGASSSIDGGMPPLMDKINDLMNGYLREQHSMLLIDKEESFRTNEE